MGPVWRLTGGKVEAFDVRRGVFKSCARGGNDQGA